MPTLFIVATPIGNLKDVTLRALETLSEVDFIICEDTRVTRKLLTHHQIRTPVVSCHAHSSASVVERLVDRISAGENAALVTDAGTPVVSDPGTDLVRVAIDRGLDVCPIPGASAPTVAISAAGLAATQTLFLGFLPRSGRKRRDALAPLRELPYTIVLFESPHRLRETLEDLVSVLGDRAGVVAREMTKRFEQFVRGPLSTLHDALSQPVRGEVVIVVAPAAPHQAEADEEGARAEALVRLGQGEQASQIARAIASSFGLSRKDAYALVLELKDQ